MSDVVSAFRGLAIAVLSSVFLIACGGGGGGGGSIPPPAGPSAPAAPTGVQGRAGDGSATLNWAAVAQATSYRVYRGTTSGGATTLVASPTATTHTDTGLTNGSTYFYVVRSHNGTTESSNSTQIEVTPAVPPPAPTGVSAAAADASINLTWTAVTGATEYRVYRGAASGAATTLVASPTATNQTDTGLTNGTTYFYVVSAIVGGRESANSTEVSATPSNFPAPSGVTAARGNGVVSVNWSAANGATSYKVLRSTTAGSGYTQVGTPTGASYIDSGLTNDTTYYYVVRSVDATRESPNSSEVSATPKNLAAPPPSNATSDEFTAGALTGWTTYDGYASTPDQATFSMTGSQLSIAIPGGAEHNMWLLRHAAALRAYPGSGVYEAKVDSNLNGHQQVGIVFQTSLGTALYFMLYVDKDPPGKVFGYSERFVNVTLDDNTATGKETKPGPGSDGADLGITNPATGPFYLRVEVAEAPQPDNRSWKFSWSPNGTDWYVLVDEDLEDAAANQNIGTIQQVGVFAGNQPSDFDAFNARFDYFRYYPSANKPIDAPTNLSARAGDHQVELWWDAVAGAEGYNVYSASAPNAPFTLLASTTQTSILDASVSNGSSRSYLVRTVRSGLEGPASAIQSVVPTASTEFAALPTANLVVALSASQLSSLQLANTNPVKVWPNAVGPKISASAITGQGSMVSSAPRFIASGINGKPVVRFDGANDFLSLPSGFQDFSAGLSLYVVMKPTGVLQDGLKILSLGTRSNRGQNDDAVAFGRAGSTGGLQYITNISAGGAGYFETSDPPGALVIGESAVFSVTQDAGSLGGSSAAQAAKNGVVLPGGQPVRVASSASRDLNFIGKSYWYKELVNPDGWLQGDVAEVILYNRKVTVNEDTAIRGYLSTKYNLP